MGGVSRRRWSRGVDVEMMRVRFQSCPSPLWSVGCVGVLQESVRLDTD